VGIQANYCAAGSAALGGFEPAKQEPATGRICPADYACKEAIRNAV